MGYRFRMENQPYSPPSSDFSSEWIDLSQRIRTRAFDLSSRTAGTHLAGDAAALANDVLKLCDHVERIHHGAGELLSSDGSADPIRIGEVRPELKADDAQREAVKIRREGHEMRPDLKDIIKALFMWQDDPVERARTAREPTSGD